MILTRGRTGAAALAIFLSLGACAISDTRLAEELAALGDPPGAVLTESHHEGGSVCIDQCPYAERTYAMDGTIEEVRTDLLAWVESSGFTLDGADWERSWSEGRLASERFTAIRGDLELGVAIVAPPVGEHRATGPPPSLDVTLDMKKRH